MERRAGIELAEGIGGRTKIPGDVAGPDRSEERALKPCHWNWKSTQISSE